LKSKRLIAIVSVLLCAVMLVGCGGDGVSSAVSQNVSSEEMPVNNTDNIKKYTRTVGRTTAGMGGEKGMYFSWTCSGIEFEFEGTAAYAVLSADEKFGSDSQVLAGVFVDGEKKHSSTVVLTPEKQEITLCKELEEGTHTVMLLKLSEAQYGSMYVESIRVDGSNIRPTEQPELLFEFIGDAVTCGSGTRAKYSSSDLLPHQGDGSESFAWLTAAEFGAEASFVSVSGIGVYKNSDGSMKNTMGDIYTSSAIYFENRHGIYPYTQLSENGHRPADAVVVNLGQTDELLLTSNAERSEFEREYVELLKLIRQVNPDAYVICTYGSLRYELYDNVANAVKDYCIQSGDQRVLAFSMDYLSSVDHNGTLAGCPSPKAHGKMATKLIKKVKSVLKK